MSAPFEFRLTDAFGNSVQFHSLKEIQDFIAGEEETWGWLQEGSHQPFDMRANYLPHFGQLRAWVDQVQNGQLSPEGFISNFTNYYHATEPQLVLSEFQPGSIVQIIHEEEGASVGERALAMVTKRRPADMSNWEEFRIWQRVASPSLLKPESWLREHSRKLGAARASFAKEIANLQAQTGELTTAQTELNRREIRRYREVAVALLRGAGRRATRVQQRAEKQIASIESTERAYTEQMRLNAPVQYWQDKGTGHGKAVVRWGIALAIYLASAAIGASVLITEVWDAIPAGDALSGKHFLLAAGVGAVLTLLFWMARLIVRIYLGERHLKTDAEERRVMTQAYLALIKEAAATDEERIVILSALFRTAQDGIVREDGAGDISLPAMIARLLDARTKA